MFVQECACTGRGLDSGGFLDPGIGIRQPSRHVRRSGGTPTLFIPFILFMMLKEDMRPTTSSSSPPAMSAIRFFDALASPRADPTCTPFRVRISGLGLSVHSVSCSAELEHPHSTK